MEYVDVAHWLLGALGGSPGWSEFEFSRKRDGQ